MLSRSPNSKRVLSISYDVSLLRTRRGLLEQAGFEVASASDLSQALKLCQGSDSRFDLVILGHSVPPEEKKEFIACLKQHSEAPILALLKPNEPPVEGAARSVESMDVPLFLSAVRQTLDRR
jgi:DNA-binding response OmpR family regulator